MEHLRERLRNLLLLLLEAIDARQEGQAMLPDDLREMISAAGYGEQEMSELMSLLNGRWAASSEEEAWLSSRQLGRASRHSLRQMGPGEDELITVPAFGYLLDLVRTEQLTAEQMESLIQFAQLAPSGPLTTRDLSQLVDRVVFEPDDNMLFDSSNPRGSLH